MAKGSLGSFGSRRRDLEEAFFGERDQQLLQELREQAAAKEKRQMLAEASGIADHGVLEQLIQLEMCGETVAALSLVPLIAVAWADRKMDAKERTAILAAAEKQGLEPGHAGHQMLQRWLDNRPHPALLTAWKNYVAGCAQTIGQDARESLKSELLGRARVVAEATGGLLGLGSKISQAEQAVLDDLASAFD